MIGTILLFGGIGLLIAVALLVVFGLAISTPGDPDA